MSVTFIEGKAGCGKTAFCLEKIKENIKGGVKSVLIVPEQISLSFEKIAVKEFGFLGNLVDVLSFNRLFYSLSKGNNDRNYVSKVGKTILMNRAVSKASTKLIVYKNSAKNPDFSGQMLKTVTELKRHGVTPSELLKASENIGEANVKSKLCDICLIYEIYDRLVAEKGADSDENLSVLADLVKNSEAVKHTEFFIDCFSSFTGEELAVVKALVENAKNVYITLKKGEGYIFESVERTAEKIREFGKVNTVILKENKKHKNELLHLAENYPLIMPSVYDKEPEKISIYYGENPLSECESLMQSITKKVRDEGYSFKDIGILAGNLEEYSNILKETFERYSINGYIAEKKSLLSHPVGVFILSFLELVFERLEIKSVMKFLKSGLTPLAFEEICLLENYVLDVNIRGKLWFDEFKYKEKDYSLEKINETRNAFIELISPYYEQLKGRHTAKEYVDLTKSFMEKTQLKEKTDKLTNVFTKAGRPELALEYRQVFNSIVDVLNQFENCMTDETFGAEKFYEMLLNAFNETKISTYPPECDMVIVGDADSLRHNEFKILYIIGANSGKFPAPVTGTGIIKDSERRILEKNEINIAPDNRKKALEQPFKIYELLCIPTDELILSYTLTNAGGEGEAPSMVLSDIKKLFPFIKEKSFVPEKEIDLICTPLSSARYAVKGETSIMQSAKKWYLKNETLRFKKMLKAKYYRVSSSTTESSARLLWEGQLNLSISKLEAFAKCPFAFFLQYGLKLKERNVYDFNIMDRGTLTHSFMEEFTNYVIDNNIDWYKITKEDIDSIFNKMSKNGIKDLTEKMPVTTNRHKFLTEKLTQTAKNALSAVVYQVQSGKFVPFTTELDLATDKRVTPIKLKTPTGLDIVLNGKIDRIDRCGEEYRIIDYKSSSKELDLSEVYNGMMLQLFVYSNALKDFFGQSKGMFYFGVVPDVSQVKSVDEKGEINMKSYALNGFLVGDEEVYEQMAEGKGKTNDVVKNKRLLYTEYEALSKKVFEHIEVYGDRISKGEFEIHPALTKKTDGCQYCSFRSVCGFDTSVGSYNEKETIDVKEALKEDNNG